MSAVVAIVAVIIGGSISAFLWAPWSERQGRLLDLAQYGTLLITFLAAAASWPFYETARYVRNPRGVRAARRLRADVYRLTRLGVIEPTTTTVTSVYAAYRFDELRTWSDSDLRTALGDSVGDSPATLASFDRAVEYHRTHPIHWWRW